MACRVGGMYGRKRTFGYPKSYGGGSKAAGTAAPSVGRKSPRQSAKAAFDRAAAVKSAFALLSAKVTKEGLCPDTSRTTNVREDSSIMRRIRC